MAGLSRACAQKRGRQKRPKLCERGSAQRAQKHPTHRDDAHRVRSTLGGPPRSAPATLSTSKEADPEPKQNARVRNDAYRV